MTSAGFVTAIGSHVLLHCNGDRLTAWLLAWEGRRPPAFGSCSREARLRFLESSGVSRVINEVDAEEWAVRLNG
jgi:hypothetical protein